MRAVGMPLEAAPSPAAFVRGPEAEAADLRAQVRQLAAQLAALRAQRP